MRLSIPLGVPGWRILAKIGFPIHVKIQVIYDKESDVYIAHGVNFRGLIVEANTLDDVRKEVLGVIDDILELNYAVSKKDHHTTNLCFDALITA